MVKKIDMKSSINISLLLLLILTLFGCENSLSPSDYIKWVRNPDNGLRKVENIGDVVVDLQFKPIPFVISNEFRKETIAQKDFEARAQELEGLQYYTLKITPKENEVKDLTYLNVRNQQEYQERLYYYSYLMQNDVHLVDGKDTLACKLYHFERSFDLAKHRNFVLAFDSKASIADDKTLILDSQMFGAEPINIKLNKKDLVNLPDLKIKS